MFSSNATRKEAYDIIFGKTIELENIFLRKSMLRELNICEEHV